MFRDRTRLLGLPAALTPHLKGLHSLTQHSELCLQPLCGNIGNYMTHLLAATWTADAYMADRFPVILPPQSGNDSEVAATNKRDKAPDMDKSYYILSGPLTVQNNYVIQLFTLCVSEL